MELLRSRSRHASFFASYAVFNSGWTLNNTFKREEIAALNRSELVKLAWAEHQLLEELQAELQSYNLENETLLARAESMNDLLDKLKKRLFGSLSEKSKGSGGNSGKKLDKSKSKNGENPARLPSERYPNAEIVDIFPGEHEILPCACCGEPMHGLGKYDISEQLSSKPREIIILRYHRERKSCSHCEGSMALVPLPPRIIPGSSYSDSFILDVALSKYCDLIPVERFCAMAERQGCEDAPYLT
jgi:hypothetical protein